MTFKNELREATKKKTTSSFSVNISHGDLNGTTSVRLGTLPANCLVVGSYVVTTTAGASSGNALDILIGSTVINNDATITAGVDSSYTAAYTGTGADINIRAKATTAWTAGEFTIVVLFIELGLTNGQLLQYVN